MANDFSGDTNCVALWKLESGALPTDSKGTNTLDDTYGPDEDTVNQQEGNCCADFDGSQGLTCDDADLDSGFPFKYGWSGDEMSVALWFYVQSDTDGLIFGKFTVDNMQFCIIYENAGNKLQFRYSANGTSVTTLVIFSSLSLSQWYHLGLTFKVSTRGLTARLWNGSSASDFSDTLVSDIYDNASQLQIGGLDWDFTGKEDEIVVFKDLLTSGEIDQIRQGTYSVGGGISIPVVINHLRQQGIS